MDSYEKVLQKVISNGCSKVALDILMFSSSDLFQFRDAFKELSKTSVGVKDGKMEVNFSRASSMNTPLCIVIPKHPVPHQEKGVWSWEKPKLL